MCAEASLPLSLPLSDKKPHKCSLFFLRQKKKIPPPAWRHAANPLAMAELASCWRISLLNVAQNINCTEEVTFKLEGENSFSGNPENAETACKTGVFFFFPAWSSLLDSHKYWEARKMWSFSVSCEYVQHLHSCHSKDLPTNRILDPLPSSLVQHLLKASVFKEVGN